MFIRSDQALISVSFTAVSTDKQPWSMLDGGDLTSENAQAFPGGMRPLVALGGFAKPTAVTVERPWEEALITLYKTLWPRVGQETGSVSYQALNANKEAYGPVVTYTGVLSSLTRPNYKAGTSEEAKLKAIFELNGEVF